MSDQQYESVEYALIGRFLYDSIAFFLSGSFHSKPPLCRPTRENCRLIQGAYTRKAWWIGHLACIDNP